MSPPAADRPKAYSYLRFSTPEQMRGDSFRRQTTMAQEYAVRNGLDLDAELTFRDLGVSAYRGANAEAGRLAEFLEAVRAGQVVPGSYLLVEALDRLSRLVPRKAYRVLEDIVTAGITVVTLNDGRVYTTESLDSDPTSLLVAIVLFMRANEESATKARRVRAAWEGKRLRAKSTPLTAQVPAWIRLDRATEPPSLVLVPDRAGIVRRIFDEYLGGKGHHSISERLNAEGIPCFGTAAHWHRTYIKKILESPATWGAFVPHTYTYEGSKRLRTPLDPVEGYYPAVVSQEQFDQAQSLRSSGRSPKRRAGQVVNLFGGLAECPLCGATMTRVNKGSGPKGGRPKLVCTRAKAKAGCRYQAVDMATAEEALLRRPDLLTGLAPSEDAHLESRITALSDGISAMQDAVQNLLDALGASPSATIAARVRELEVSLEEQKAERDGLLLQLATSAAPVLAKRLAQLETSLSADPLDRAQANAALRLLIDAVVIDFESGNLRFRWKHGGESEVRYKMPAKNAAA